MERSTGGCIIWWPWRVLPFRLVILAFLLYSLCFYFLPIRVKVPLFDDLFLGHEGVVLVFGDFDFSLWVFFTVYFLLLLIYLLIVYFWLFGVMCSGVWPCTLCVLVSLIVAQTRSLHSFFHFVILYLTYGKILVKEAIASAQHYINSTLFGNQG